ncbi:MAG: outer membrane protein assembly factor BamD [Chitinispirillales bacterium]|jgi:outer membrane assembly lipoprotein YfiO|nr:outer membrane protein assembly factor BamD [Chitinispirillales bacterium]
MKKITAIMICFFLFIPSFAKRKSKEIRCEARFNSGIETFNNKKYSRTINLLSIVKNECGAQLDSPDSLYYLLGNSYMKCKKYEDARTEFRTIIEDYPHSEFIEDAYYAIAYCSFKSAPIIQRDNRLLLRAEREFSSFVSAYPKSELSDSARIYLDTISEKLLEKEILNAEYYEITNKYESAVIYYQSIIEDYRQSNRLPEMQLKLAKNLVAANRLAEALDQIEILERDNLFKNDTESLRKKIISKDKTGVK